MILSTREKTINTLGAPIIVPKNGDTSVLGVIQSLSLSCSRNCGEVFLSKLDVENSHIKASFSTLYTPAQAESSATSSTSSDTPSESSDNEINTRSVSMPAESNQLNLETPHNIILCYLDANINDSSLIYKLEGASEEFIDGFVLLSGFSGTEIHYSGNNFLVNPLYIHRSDVKAKSDTYSFKLADYNSSADVVIRDSIDIRQLKTQSTATVLIENTDGFAVSEINQESEGVSAELGDKITSINGTPLAENSSITLDFKDKIEISRCGDSYAEISAANTNSCPQANYLETKLAPRGRSYYCPLDFLYGLESSINGNAYSAPVSDYDIDRINDKKFNSEYSGCETESGFTGLTWNQLNPLHDTADELDCP